MKDVDLRFERFQDVWDSKGRRGKYLGEATDGYFVSFYRPETNPRIENPSGAE